MEEMTLHRALIELKLIDAKIKSQINRLVPMGLKQEGKLVNKIQEEQEFIKNATSTYQSINDLFIRKEQLKSAVVLANTRTNVVIGKKTMTIAEAIHTKSLIESKQELVDFYKKVYQTTISILNKENTAIEMNANKLAEQALGKDNVKTSDTEATAIIETYVNKFTFKLVDPLNLSTVIENLETEIQTFLSEVDVVLSEANSTTKITIGK